jgi:hypothetical protein
MTFLDQLSFDQKEMLISLPYRVGLWIGRSDMTGGDKAEEKELNALSSIIRGFAEEIFGSENMQHIISGTMARKEQWPVWAKDINSVPEDCRMAVEVMAQHTDAKDVRVFRNHLMEIGEAVALAFHENMLPDSFLGKAKIYLNYYFSGFKKGPKGRKRSFDEYLRISPVERKALNMLAKSLGTDF